jgi:hypothetical protein
VAEGLGVEAGLGGWEVVALDGETGGGVVGGGRQMGRHEGVGDGGSAAAAVPALDSSTKGITGARAARITTRTSEREGGTRRW